MPNVSDANHSSYYAECNIGTDVAAVSVDTTSVEVYNSRTNQKINIGEVRYFPSTGTVKAYFSEFPYSLKDSVVLRSNGIKKIGGTEYSFDKAGVIKAVVSNDIGSIFVSDIKTDGNEYEVRVVNSSMENKSKLLQVFGIENGNVVLLSEHHINLGPFDGTTVKNRFASAGVPERMGWKIYAILR